MMEVPILSGEQAGLNGGALIKASNNLKKNVVVESTDSIFTFPRTSSSFIFALQNS
jgi:CRISPR/Cas system-associated endonuclease Cas1